MKYLGILKDSLFEAIDTKVFYVTIGLSCLVVLLIGSVTFRPVPAEEQFEGIAKRLNIAFGFVPSDKRPHVSSTEFEETSSSAEPWERDYRVVYVLDHPATLSDDEVKYYRKLLRDVLTNFCRDSGWVGKFTLDDSAGAGTGFELKTTGSKIKDRRGWPHEPALFFGAVTMSFMQSPLSGQVSFIADFLIGTFGAAITMLLSTVITSFFIPNMLRKGTIDLLLAKPIHRSTLLVYKFVGGMTFMFLNTLVIMVGIWFVLGLQTKLWLNGLLLCIGIFTFQFAIFYVVSTLMAVVTRSAIVAILTSVSLWGLLWFIGWGYRFVDAVRPEKLEGKPQAEVIKLPGWVFVTVDVIHFVTPHYKDLDVLTTQLINRGLLDPDSEQQKQFDKAVGSINWTESLGVTIAFITLVLGLACWRFSVKDY